MSNTTQRNPRIITSQGRPPYERGSIVICQPHRRDRMAPRGAGTTSRAPPVHTLQCGPAWVCRGAARAGGEPAVAGGGGARDERRRSARKPGGWR